MLAVGFCYNVHLPKGSLLHLVVGGILHIQPLIGIRLVQLGRDLGWQLIVFVARLLLL